MPPRYAYWTILIDGKATAFRAKESEELLPTLNQLRRKNEDVLLRYFSRGKLWDSPEQALWAAKNAGGFGEKRGAGWRPGGTHEDPRARFDKKRKRDNAAKTGSRDAGVGARRDPPPRPTDGDSRSSRPPAPFARDRKSGWTPKPDRPRENSRPPKSFTDREQRGGRPPAKPFATNRGEARPLPTPRPEDNRPWSGKPREQDRRGPQDEGRSEGRRPWTPKPRSDEQRPWTPKPPRGEGQRPWSGKPGGRPPQSPRGGPDTRYGQKPDYQNRGENRPREDRPRNERPDNVKGRDEGRRPWSDGSRSRDDRPGARKPFGQQQGTGRWPKPDDRNRGAAGGHGAPKPFDRPKSNAGGWTGKPARKPWTPKPDRRDSTSGSRPPSTDRPRRDDWRTRPARPAPPERPEGGGEAAPKPPRQDRPDRTRAAEKIVRKPKPPERG